MSSKTALEKSLLVYLALVATVLVVYGTVGLLLKFNVIGGGAKSQKSEETPTENSSTPLTPPTEKDKKADDSFERLIDIERVVLFNPQINSVAGIAFTKSDNGANLIQKRPDLIQVRRSTVQLNETVSINIMTHAVTFEQSTGEGNLLRMERNKDSIRLIDTHGGTMIVDFTKNLPRVEIVDHNASLQYDFSDSKFEAKPDDVNLGKKLIYLGRAENAAGSIVISHTNKEFTHSIGKITVELMENETQLSAEIIIQIRGYSKFTIHNGKGYMRIEGTSVTVETKSSSGIGVNVPWETQIMEIRARKECIFYQGHEEKKLVFRDGTMLRFSNKDHPNLLLLNKDGDLHLNQSMLSIVKMHSIMLPSLLNKDIRLSATNDGVITCANADNLISASSNEKLVGKIADIEFKANKNAIYLRKNNETINANIAKETITVSDQVVDLEASKDGMQTWLKGTKKVTIGNSEASIEYDSLRLRATDRIYTVVTGTGQNVILNDTSENNYEATVRCAESMVALLNSTLHKVETVLKFDSAAKIHARFVQAHDDDATIGNNSTEMTITTAYAVIKKIPTKYNELNTVILDIGKQQTDDEFA